MSKLRVNSFTLSLDGYGAGPGQSLDHPLGIGGVALDEWAFATRTFRRMHGNDGVVKLGYRCTEHVPTAAATHVALTREHRSGRIDR